MIKYLDLKRLNEPYVHAADEVLQSGWYLRGEVTRRFEQHYADYIGTKHCIGCGNGLDALTLILRAYKELGVMQEGDEVIVPANTYIASILSITENRLVPVLVEPDINTLQIDDTFIEQSITEKTKALMIVHLYGRCAYTEKIGELCSKYGLRLIEDNAQAHGCRFGDKRTGALGDAAAHSFYPTKNLGAFGDAGAVTTDDSELAALVRSLGNYGSSRHYMFDFQGRNSRMDEVQAAIIDAKLRDLDKANCHRRMIANNYINKVKHIDVFIPNCDRDSVFHIFPVITPRRDELKQYLTNNGIETEIHYPIPPHRQLCYSGWEKMELPVTDTIHEQELSLPCNPALTEKDVEIIVKIINAF